MKIKLLFFVCTTLFSFSSVAQWISQASGFSTADRGIISISAVDANIVWALAYDGTNGATTAIQEFTKTTNGGSTWTAGTITGAAGLSPSHLVAVDVNTAWAVLYDNTNGGGAVFKTADGGATWTKQTTSAFAAPNGFPNNIHFWDVNNGVCIGDPNGGYFEIYTTTNGGNSWTRVPQGNIPAMITGEYPYNSGAYSVVGNTIWFTTNKGRIFKSTDKGLNWTAAATGLANTSRVTFKNASTGICNNMTTLKISNDGGITWGNITPAPVGTFYSGNYKYIPGTAGTIMSVSSVAPIGSSYSLDDGKNWVAVDAVKHNGLAFVNATTGWSGDFNTDAVTAGMFKWSGSALAGLAEMENKENNVFVFPNPSSGIFFAGINSATTGEEIKLRIRDMAGRIIYSTVFYAESGRVRKGIDLNAYTRGMYMVSVEKAGSVHTEKILLY